MRLRGQWVQGNNPLKEADCVWKLTETALDLREQSQDCSIVGRKLRRLPQHHFGFGHATFPGERLALLEEFMHRRGPRAGLRGAVTKRM
jgi:hypothetical protein